MKQVGSKDTPKTATELRKEKRHLESSLDILEDKVRLTRQGKPTLKDNRDIKTLKDQIEEIKLKLKLKQTEARMGTVRTPTKTKKTKTDESDLFTSTTEINQQVTTTTQPTSIQAIPTTQPTSIQTIPTGSAATEQQQPFQQNLFLNLPLHHESDEQLGATAIQPETLNKTFNFTTSFTGDSDVFLEDPMAQYKHPGRNIFGEPLTTKETGTKKKTTNLKTTSANKQQNLFEEPKQPFNQKPSLREEFERYKEDQKYRNTIYENKIKDLYEENRILKSKSNFEAVQQQDTDPYINALQTVMKMIRKKQLNAAQKNEIMDQLLEEGAHEPNYRKESIEIFQPIWAQTRNIPPVSPIPQLNVTQTYDPNPQLNRTTQTVDQNTQLNRTMQDEEPRNQVQRRNVREESRESFTRRLKHIPIFDGESFKSLKSFLDIAEILNDQWRSETEKNELIDTLSLNLRSEARNVVGDLYETTFEEMREKLLKHFSYLANKEVVTSQLENLKQEKNETINEYAERSRKLLKDKCSTYKYLSEEQKREYDRTARKAFAKGIKDSKVRDRLITRGAISLEDAIAYSIELDYDAANMIPNSELFCKYCKTNGHRERDCRKKESNANGVNTLISLLRRENQNIRNFVNFKGPRQNRNWTNNRGNGNNNYNNYNNGNNNNGNGNRFNPKNSRNWNNGNNNNNNNNWNNYQQNRNRNQGNNNNNQRGQQQQQQQQKQVNTVQQQEEEVVPSRPQLQQQAHNSSEN